MLFKIYNILRNNNFKTLSVQYTYKSVSSQISRAETAAGTRHIAQCQFIIFYGRRVVFISLVVCHSIQRLFQVS